MSQTRFCTLLDNSHFLFLLKIINFLLLKNISYKIRGAWEEIRMENLPPQKQFLEILPVLTCISCREVKARLLCFIPTPIAPLPLIPLHCPPPIWSRQTQSVAVRERSCHFFSILLDQKWRMNGVRGSVRDLLLRE